MWIIQQRYVDTERQTISLWANLPYIYDYKEDAERGIKTWRSNYVLEPKIHGLDYEYRIAKAEVSE